MKSTIEFIKKQIEIAEKELKERIHNLSNDYEWGTAKGKVIGLQIVLKFLIQPTDEKQNSCITCGKRIKENEITCFDCSIPKM